MYGKYVNTPCFAASLVIILSVTAVCLALVGLVSLIQTY